MKRATSLEGYKHTAQLKLKMAKRFINKTYHAFSRKHHDEQAKALLSKPGTLNPMYGKIHSQETKHLMKSKNK